MPEGKTPQEPGAAAPSAHAARVTQRPGDRAQPLPRVPRLRGSVRWHRRAPFLQLLLYYALLVSAIALLISEVPAVRNAFVAPVLLPAAEEATALLTGTPATPEVASALTLAETRDRVLGTLLVITGALALVVPVAAVYMWVKRLQYDPALVRSVIILPIVVAGIAMVVKNSLALAFSLAGIVAAVRFRNTLKDPRDAVYIFLVIGIGLSAGVQAMDVALVMSLVFNFVVLILWRFNIGSIYSGRYARTGILSTGDTDLLVAEHSEQRRALRRQMLGEVHGEEDLQTDGILLVHSHAPELARQTVQEALVEMAKDWRLVNIAPRGAGLSTLEYLLRLKKKTTPAELIGALDDRWSSQVAAAEYVPFRTRQRDRNPANPTTESRD